MHYSGFFRAKIKSCPPATEISPTPMLAAYQNVVVQHIACYGQIKRSEHLLLSMDSDK